MLKKIVVMMLTVCAFFICGNAFAGIINVPGDYPTIQQAIDVAQPGDDVVVGPGTYNEAVVMKQGVNLVGAGPQATVIRSSSRAVITAASGTTISNLKIEGFPQNPPMYPPQGAEYGIWCDNVITCRITNVEVGSVVEDTGGYRGSAHRTIAGIFITNSANIFIDNNVIHGITDYGDGTALGVFALCSSEITIYKNRIYGIREYSVHHAMGIYINTCSQVNIYNNLIYDLVGSSGPNMGIMSDAASYMNVINNVVSGIEGGNTPGDWGIYTRISSYCTLSNNIIANVDYGIEETSDCTNNTVSYNDVWQAPVPYIIMGAAFDNINVDPMFIGGSDASLFSYYTLNADSPCIDAGAPDTQYNDTNGTRNDMGVFGGSFRYAPPENADVFVFTFSTRARPGFDTEYTIIYGNRGGEKANNVDLRHILPKDVTLISCDPMYEVNGRIRLRWNIGDLASGAGGFIKVKINVPPETPLGTVLDSTTTIKAAGREDNDYNNIFYCRETVVGSYDPNDKGVTPQGFIKGDEALAYVINFENEGTAEAVNIKIIDTLSDNLDDSTLSQISNSGVYDFGTRTITWNLQDINLPPSGTGAVYFSIKPKEGLTPGTAIHNKANIIFDFNPPMDTPETITIIGNQEQIALQETARNLAAATEEMETSLIDLTPNLQPYFVLLDEAMGAAWQAFNEINDSQLPWKSFNRCQEKITEFKELLLGQGIYDLPAEIVNEWTAAIDNDLIPGIVEIYPPEPIAIAGSDSQSEAEGQLTLVRLDGSASYCPNPAKHIETYSWYDENGELAATGISPQVAVPLDSHSFTLVVNDGNMDSVAINTGTQNDSVVAIEVVDTTPPDISVSLTPNRLWPPNHKMVNITATVAAGDMCDPAPTVVLSSIVSNEPDNGQGDGDTPDDIQGVSVGTDDYSFLLRAERSGKSSGRVYTVTYTTTDASGNSKSATAVVTVPHDAWY